MGGETLFMLLFGMILVGYIILYLKGRKYLEAFQGMGAGQTGPSARELYPTPPPLLTPTGPIDARPGRVIMEQVNLDTVAKDRIQSLDDYEYNMVYQNESDRELSQALKNKLMSQRPMEWAGLPPSSAQFQAGLRESFQNGSRSVPDNAQPYQDVNGETMVPPDTETMEIEERKLLQTYKAPSIQELGSYNPDEEPEKLIHRLYDKKGLVPTIAHKEGTNVYEITGVRKKDEKIMYEDEEAPASIGPVPGAGEAQIVVPPTAYDTAAAKDPYYNTDPGAGRTRVGKWDFQSWTPGLERVFAPTNQTESWY